MQPNDPLIGQRLANFQIKHLIERGGMASVYYGWDSKLLRPAAIKVIDTQFQDLAYAKRLVQEARIMAQWHHENVIQVYYADQRDRLYFFAMEYVDGLDLGSLMAQYVHSGELIPYPDVVRIGRSIAAALDFAHQHGVIHRDVKPSNVMMAADGRVVLTDFGLALDTQKGTLGEVLGTPHYISPEQAHDSVRAVPQSDLYSLGVVLYEMLTGSVPFDDPSPMSLAMKHMTDEPPLPTQLNPSLSIPVEAVLLKGLSKAPEDRYQTGAALMDALESALSFSSQASTTGRMNTPVASALASHAVSRGTQPAAPPDTMLDPAGMLMSTRPASPRWPWLLIGGLGIIGLIAVGVLILVLASAANAPTAVSQNTPVPPQSSEPVSAATQLAAGPTTEPGQLNTPLPNQPTESSVGVPSPPAGTYPVTLLYTDRGFYLWNKGSSNLQVSMLTFEALDASGTPAPYRFQGLSWAEFFPRVEPGLCAIIEITGTSAYLTRPAECNSFNAQRTPDGSSAEIFWIAREGISQFRVLWVDQEIGRCDIASGRCDVLLPLP